MERGLDKNVDIRFRGVEYIELPIACFKLSFEEATDADSFEVRTKLNRDLYEDEKLLILRCDSQRYKVVAFHVVVEENELELFDSTLEREF